MRYQITFFWLALNAGLILAIAGCRASASVEPEHRTQTVTEQTTVVSPNPLRAQSERIEDYAADIQRAADPIAEASAIQRLRRFERDHDLTYTVKTVRLDSGVTVPSGSVQGVPVRADVSVFKGQVPIYNFSFIPKDNRNLALLGE